MASRLEKEKAKKQNDRHQSILAEMLQENDNKFCADCNAKGPRWASWNLGVFLCIRCAGIHRNLGVHISRVKSVNLDSWTPEQIENIQQWGNKLTHDVYEYYLPEDFRRPQGDSAMEAFIRNKYEKKIYLRKDGVAPPKRTVNNSKEPENKEKQIKRERKKEKETAKVERPKPSNNVPVSSAPAPVKAPSSAAPSQPPAPEPVQSNIVDLLSLDTPTPTQQPGLVDLFGSAPTQNIPPVVVSQAPQVDLFAPQSAPVSQAQPQGNSQASQNSQPSSDPQAIEDALFESGGTKAKSAKDSIMALYQSQSSQSQMFGVPGGMYMSSSQPKAQPQATPQQAAGYQMFNGAMMGYPQQPQQQMNRQMGFPQQQQQQQQFMPQQHQQMPQQHQQMPQQLQVGQIQQQMQQLRLKHSMSQPSLINNHPSNLPNNLPNNQMQFMTQPQQMTNWISQPQLAGFQQQNQPQFVTTGPVNNMQGYNMFPMGATPPVGNTMSNQLWK